MYSSPREAISANGMACRINGHISNVGEDMKTIALILPYFGCFKNYFPMFLESCKNNPTIDWMIYTDSNERYEWPKNVHVTKITFDEFKRRIQANFDFPICLDRPYKLCDFKPSYGEVLKEDLLEFDFWGYCDCDLIFGDIRKFLTDKLLEQYDKLFSRGHLSIFRNNEKVNTFYRTQTEMDWKSIYQSNCPFAFDEWGGISNLWDKAHLPFYDELIMDDIVHTLDGFHPTKQLRGYGSPYHEHNEDVSSRYKKMRHIAYLYNDGLKRIWVENDELKSEEVLYVHFQKRNFEFEGSCDRNRFLIVPNRFIDVGDIDSLYLRKTSPDRMTVRNCVSKLKRIIRNVLK